MGFSLDVAALIFMNNVIWNHYLDCSLAYNDDLNRLNKSMLVACSNPPAATVRGTCFMSILFDALIIKRRVKW